MTERHRVLLGRGLFGIGVLLAVLWVAAAIDAVWFQSQSATRLREWSQGRDGARLAVAREARREASSSGLIGRIEIPRLRLKAFVHEGVGSRALGRGVGHVPSSAFPGEAGNVALAGHRDSWFRRLRGIERGDTIRLSTPDGRFSYEVERVLIVAPSRSDLIAPSRKAKLTLVTCYPFHWIGPAPKRLVVQARPADHPAPRAQRETARARADG